MAAALCLNCTPTLSPNGTFLDGLCLHLPTDMIYLIFVLPFRNSSVGSYWESNYEKKLSSFLGNRESISFSHVFPILHLQRISAPTAQCSKALKSIAPIAYSETLWGTKILWSFPVTLQRTRGKGKTVCSRTGYAIRADTIQYNCSTGGSRKRRVS